MKVAIILKSLSYFLLWISETYASCTMHMHISVKKDIAYGFCLKVTLLVHGEEGLRIAERTTAVLYKQDLRTLSKLSAEEARQIFQGAPYLR